MKKAKRNNATIVISSSDDDQDFSIKSKSVPMKKRAKTVSFSASCPRSSILPTGFDEMKRFCEEFDGDFAGIKVSAGLQNNDMWVDKHTPHALEELAVHKKKVEEVKVWFEERLKAVTVAN